MTTIAQSEQDTKTNDMPTLTSWSCPVIHPEEEPLSPFKRRQKNCVHRSSTWPSQRNETHLNQLPMKDDSIEFSSSLYEDFYLTNTPPPSQSERLDLESCFNEIECYANDSISSNSDTPHDLDSFFNFINNEPFDDREYSPLEDNDIIPDFSSMNIGSILNLKYDIKQLIKYHLIFRLMTDQKGSRYLQHLLSSSKHCDRLYIISLLINYLTTNKFDLTLLSVDVYGNYLIQYFFSYGNNHHHQILLSYFVYSSVLRLCRSRFGCRVIQKILTSVKDVSCLLSLIECFKVESAQTLRECLVCHNSNHVIQAMINLKLPFRTMAFIGEELGRDLVSYCTNVYSCRVVQAFFNTYGDKLDISQLLSNDNHLYLCVLKYGNYIIQNIMQKGKWYSNFAVINKFRNKLIEDAFNEVNILYLSRDKHGSNVIETCIKVSNNTQLNSLINKLCSKRSFILKEMISHCYGKYVVVTLIKNATKNQKKKLLNAIHRDAVTVDNTVAQVIGKCRNKYNINHNRY